MPRGEILFASDEEYRRLWTIHDRYGVTWRWMVIEGAKFLQEHDLIGENAPSHLECNGNGDRTRPAWLESEQAQSTVQRVDVADHDIDHIQIEITLFESDGEPGTKSDVEAVAEPDAELDTATDDEAGATGETDSPDTKPEHEPPDADESANAAQEAEETGDATATSSTPAQEPAQDETITRARQHGARRKPAPTRDRASIPGGANDV